MADESVNSLADQLRQASTSVPTGRMSDIADELETITSQLADLLGSEDECTWQAQQAAEASTETFRAMMRLRNTLGDLSAHHGGSGGGEPASPAPAPAEPARPSEPPPVQGPDGSRYPADAGWAAPNLRERVIPNTDQRTAGFARLNGRSVGEIQSGADAWSGAVSRRVATLGIRVARRLWAHAEMKLAAMMVDTQARDGELVINNAPCGSQVGQWAGCHQTLAEFLPSGYTLTVHGTTEQGKPFSEVYRGKARQ